MEQITEAHRDTYLAAYRHEAVHLEMRDIYSTDVEKDRFARWCGHEPLDPAEEAEWWRPWLALMKDNSRQGKTLRRLRIISEPVTDYIMFEWLDAAMLVRAGEDVRWLPRRNASALLLPGNDFWMFDGETVVFTNFSGNGLVLDHWLTTDPEVVGRCKSAFEAAWALAIPHSQYQPT